MRKRDSIGVVATVASAVVLWMTAVSAEAGPSTHEDFFAVRTAELHWASATIPIRWHLYFADAEGMGKHHLDTRDDQVAANTRLARAAQESPNAIGWRRPVSLPRRGTDSGNGTLYKVLGASLFVAVAGDLASSEVAMRRGGFVEMNPAQRHRATRISAHAALPVLVWWLSEKSRRSGNETLALWMRIGMTVAYSYATIHNVRTLNQAPIR